MNDFINMGITPEYRMSLPNIPACQAYFDNLVTVDGLNFVYHRLGSFTSIIRDNTRIELNAIVDHFQLFSASMQISDVFVELSPCYSWIPADGFLFAKNEIQYQVENELVKVELDPRFVYGSKYNPPKKSKKYLLEKHLFKNVGTVSGKLENFPFSLLSDIIEQNDLSDLM